MQIDKLQSNYLRNNLITHTEFKKQCCKRENNQVDYRNVLQMRDTTKIRKVLQEEENTFKYRKWDQRTFLRLIKQWNLSTMNLLSCSALSSQGRNILGPQGIFCRTASGWEEAPYPALLTHHCVMSINIHPDEIVWKFNDKHTIFSLVKQKAKKKTLLKLKKCYKC